MDNDRFSKIFTKSLEKLGKYKNDPDSVQLIVNSVPFQDLNVETDMIEEDKQHSLIVVH